MRFAVIGVLVIASVVLSACGDVRITGELGERVLRSTGTVAAWIDATSFEDQGDGSMKRIDRVTDATELHLEFFEPVFDATADLGALPAGERTALVDDVNRGDQLSIRVRRGEALRPGDDITSLPRQGLPPEVLPFVAAAGIALREHSADNAGYPELIARPGSLITTTFAVDETTPVLLGTLTLDVERADNEDAALVGKLVVEFSTELLPERIAECNFDRSQGAVDACTLGPVADGTVDGSIHPVSPPKTEGKDE